MATADGKAAAATPTGTATLDASLWWDPFPSLLAQLEQLTPSSDLVDKLKENSAWFLQTVSFFRPPSNISRNALLSDRLKVGSHEFVAKPELRVKALDISSFLGLDEVQSYILVERSSDQLHSALGSVVQCFHHLILLQYHMERQCLLKCTRRILSHALSADIGSTESVSIREEALKMISGGLENRILNVLDNLLTSTLPERMDADLYTLCAEETMTEANLVLDILFLIYYESFCTCNGDKWRRLCLIYKGMLSGSYNLDNLAVSAEAESSFYYAKAQMLFILMETLNLETLLQMVHDKVTMRLNSFFLPKISRRSMP
ncbi:hypothetical protein MLD38_013897 [Melastoma candidum]|uniref:Uncharacterized protein n=1 Tax=Melastoma candidum TaxID=119954 RepID=A0ACB9RB47_9MYRT|nr:hypothetical protein MLD38_013897 [Melastoma candidum]